jgi:hypothetical protein
MVEMLYQKYKTLEIKDYIYDSFEDVLFDDSFLIAYSKMNISTNAGYHFN